MQMKSHWEEVHSRKLESEVSWFQKQADESLEMIDRTGLPKSAAIIDVGGGLSRLVDGLLARDYGRVRVLDISARALETTRHRLGSAADQVEWIESDVLEFGFSPGSCDLWHDRAVFHFLTGADSQRAYVNQAARAVRPGGWLVVATFAEDGPGRCSGLPVVRYSRNGLEARFVDSFRPEDHRKSIHVTPNGVEQAFRYCLMRRRED